MGDELSQSNTVIAAPETSAIGPWRRLFSFPAVLAGSLAFLVFIYARRDILELDLWWHLRNAQFLLTQGHLPVTDHYSFTASGAPVMPFEWLSELPFYAAYKLAGLQPQQANQWPAGDPGLTGLFWLVFALGTAIVLGVFRLSYLASRDLKNSFVVSVGGAFLACITLGPRPLLFGWLYLVILLLVLAAVREGRWQWLWLLPPLFCLWINSHGSWPMGMALFGIFIASGLVEGSWGNAYAERWSGPQLWRLLATAGASAAAVFLNPFGSRLVLYPFGVLFGPGSGSGGGPGIGIIEEFQSIDFRTPWGKVAMILILGLLLVAIFSRERWRLDEIGFVVVALYFCLTHARFLFLAGILLPPVFARRIKLMTPYERKSDRPLPNALALTVLLILFVVYMPGHENFHGTVEYPEGAVAYMKANGIQSNVFNDWAWGGYLIWHMPEMKVFIDARGDPYAVTGVFKDYLDAVYGVNPAAVLDKYKIQYVLMRPDSLLAHLLQQSPAWAVRYSDKDSVLLARSAK